MPRGPAPVSVPAPAEPARPTQAALQERSTGVAQAAQTGADASRSDPCATRPVVEPYRWYPALDLSRIPFHAGSGEWGERYRIVAPQPPVIRRRITVNSARELAAAALVKGSEVTIGTSIDEDTVLMGDVVDVDLVIPAGKHLRQLMVGRYTPPSITQRVRIRGTTPMSHSGGRIGSIMFLSADTQDVILDGVDLNGDDGQGGRGLLEFAFGANRVAVVNVRGNSVAWGGLHGNMQSFVMAGSNLLTGQRPRQANGFPEGWGMRGGDHLAFFRNRFEGTRYHLVRLHPTHALQYAWIAENTFIDPHEARILGIIGVESTPAGALYEAVWAQCNQIYAHSKCMPPSFEAPLAVFARFTHNVFHGDITKAQQAERQEQEGPKHDLLTGNTFGPWKAPGAAPPPGDPREIPLPADDPADDNPNIGFQPCPGPDGH